MSSQLLNLPTTASFQCLPITDAVRTGTLPATAAAQKLIDEYEQ